MKADPIISGATPPASPAPAGSPPFEVFPPYRESPTPHWKVEGDAFMRFAARVADIASGAILVDQLVRWDERKDDNREDSDYPETVPVRVLGVNECDALRTLSTTALELLRMDADRMMRWAEDYHMPRGASAGNAA